MRVDLATLESFRDENQVKSLALAMAIKTKFTNSIVYNWSYVRLAALFGLDRRTVKKYITHLRKHDLVETGKDLKVKPLYINTSYHVGINIDYLHEKTILEISYLLYHLLLKQNARKQWNAMQIKRELLKVNQVKSLKEYKDLQKQAQIFGLNIKDYIVCDTNELADLPVGRLPNYKISLTMLNIANLFNISVMKTYQVLNFMKEQGLLRSKKNIKLIKRLSSKKEAKFYSSNPHYFVSRSLNVYSKESNQYWVLGINM